MTREVYLHKPEAVEIQAGDMRCAYVSLFFMHQVQSYNFQVLVWLLRLCFQLCFVVFLVAFFAALVWMLLITLDPFVPRR